ENARIGRDCEAIKRCLTHTRRSTLLRMVKPAMRAMVAVLGASCAATSGGTGVGKTTPSPSEAAKAAVSKVMQEQYAAMSRLDGDAWRAYDAPDVVWMGDHPTGDVYIGRDAVATGLKKAIASLRNGGGSLKVQSAGLKIGLSPDGRAAWVSDDVKEEYTFPGRSQTVPYRHTEVLAEKDGKWWVQAEFWSLPLPSRKAAQIATAGGMQPLEEIREAVGPGAEPIVKAIDQFIADPKTLVAQLADREDVFLYGNHLNQKAWGVAQARKLIDAAMGGNVKLARKGLRAALTPDGQVGFVVYNL